MGDDDGLDLPNNTSELWSIMFQYSHLLSPLLLNNDDDNNRYLKWANWLNPLHDHYLFNTKNNTDNNNNNNDSSIKLIQKSLKSNIIHAENIIHETINMLKSKGFIQHQLNHEHIIQYVDIGITNYYNNNNYYEEDDDVIIIPPTTTTTTTPPPTILLS